MEDTPELHDTLQEDAEQESNETLPVPPPSFRERLRASQRFVTPQKRESSHTQETPSTDDAAQSSKRR